MSPSALLVGTVRHRRRRPVANAFRYRVHHLLLDVDDLTDLDRRVRGFGYNRAAPVSFHDADHLGPGDAPVREKLRAVLEARGRSLPGGQVLLATSPRVLGHVFNPVSWWFCHHPDGRLALVVAEVSNTFGDTHAYVLDDLEARGEGVYRARADKVLHVSPFLGLEDHRYAFTFVAPGERMVVHVEVSDGHGPVLDATQDERRRPLTTRTLWRALLGQPHVPLHTLLRIHRQAVRLWWARVPFHRRPRPRDHAEEPA